MYTTPAEFMLWKARSLTNGFTTPFHVYSRASTGSPGDIKDEVFAAQDEKRYGATNDSWAVRNDVWGNIIYGMLTRDSHLPDGASQLLGRLDGG